MAYPENKIGAVFAKINSYFFSIVLTNRKLCEKEKLSVNICGSALREN